MYRPGRRRNRRRATFALVGLMTVLAAAAAPGTAAASQGPRQYVGNMTVITGDSSGISCPAGYAKNPQNLNEAAGGDNIYLCLQYQSAVANAITSVYVAREVDTLGPPDCGDRFTKIDVDLNEGAGGVITPSFCYSRTDYLGDVFDPDTRPVRDIWFWSSPSDPCVVPLVCDGADDVIQQGCVSTKPAGRDIDTVLSDRHDLNEGAGGRYIYMCWGRGPADTAPTLTFDSRTPPNANGWNNSPVVVFWHCSDLEGPPSELFPSTILFDEGANQTATATCSDDAGHVVSDTQIGINIDLTSPRIIFNGQAPPSAEGWSRGGVVLTWTCKDDLSGVEQPTVTQALSAEGTDQSATGTCRDRAGNEVSDTQTGINVDATAPVITFVGRTPANAAGWNRDPVVLTWACQDSTSGVEETTVTRTVSAEGADQSAIGTCRDRAGNEASDTQTAVNIDRTAPEITFGSRTPAANGAGWNNGDVTVTWSCADSLSGPAQESVSGTATGEGDNLSVTGTCGDLAGNSVSASAGGIRIDRTPPLVTAAATTADGHPYASGTWTNQDVTVTFTCTDALSGVARVTPPQILSADGNDQRADGICEDNAGNAAAVTFTAIQIDSTPPVLTCGADPAALWPPNHRLVDVTASVQVVDDLAGPAGFRLVSAESNEPDDGLGDGDTAQDIAGFVIGVPDTQGRLRAERSGEGTGRVYTLGYEGEDAAGNTARCSVTVSVPHDPAT